MKISKLFLGAGLLCFGLLLGAAGPASADPTCSGVVNSSYGATSFPGTYVGTLASGGCQIGDLSQGLFDTAYVGILSNPSIYEFYYGGGSLTIQEELGINVLENDIDVELDSLSSMNSTSHTVLSSIGIPGTLLPSGEYTLVSNDNLAAGYYAIDSYLAFPGSTDPFYQINITPGSVAAPEPGSILLLAFGIAGLAFLRRRQATNEL